MWNARRQRGATLIEALVAFVILSVGLLGVASLLALSKSAQHQGIQRTRAITLANDMIERVRINPGGVPAYSSGGLTTPLGGGSITTVPETDCGSASCDQEELAEYDLWLWERSLDGASVTVLDNGVVNNTGGLVSPQACIRFVAETGKVATGLVEVIIQWRGLSRTSDAVPAGGDACGGSAAGADSYRRQVLVSTYVINEVEL